MAEFSMFYKLVACTHYCNIQKFHTAKVISQCITMLNRYSRKRYSQKILTLFCDDTLGQFSTFILLNGQFLQNYEKKILRNLGRIQ